jgi:hypothetical protein
MTNPSLNVVPAELSMRAKKIVEPLPQWPVAEPLPLCELDAAKNGAIALRQAADVVLEALGQGQRRWQALAQAVMGASEAYQGVDESSASSLDFDSLGSPIEVKKPSVASSLKFDKLVPVPSRDHTRLKETLYHADQKKDLNYHTTNNRFRLAFDNWDTFVDGLFERQGAQFIQSDELDKKFGDVKTVAQILKSGNRNASNKFKEEWAGYENSLRDLKDRYQRFDEWEGEAADKVERHFSRNIEFINNLAGLCRSVSQNAQAIIDAFDKAESNHPTLAQVEAVYKKLQFSSKLTQTEYNQAMAELEKLQQSSQEALKNYRNAVNLQALDKPAVPERITGDLFLTAEQIVERNRKKADEDARRAAEDAAHDFEGGAGGPDFANPAGLGGTRTPSLPSPQKLLSAVNQAANMAKGMGQKHTPGSAGTGLPPLDPHAPKVAPAAAMPGHGGGGVPSLGGLGKAPLQPPSLPGGGPGGGPGVGAASFTPGDAAANSLGRAAGAGGGTGGAPMGGMGAKGQDDAGKSKRFGDDEDALYTEQRAWTEGVIGLRPNVD